MRNITTVFRALVLVLALSLFSSQRAFGVDAVMLTNTPNGTFAGSPGPETVSMNGILYFTVSYPNNELWRSDGTQSGTYRVKDIGLPRGLTVINGQLYLFAFTFPEGYRLWRSDGTDAGTVPLTGSLTSNARDLTDVNGKFFFVNYDVDHHEELWKTDGTVAGTSMLLDIGPGTVSSSPYNLVNLNGKLLFSADDGVNGRELWLSDGTPAGTAMLIDINPGAASSNPAGPYVVSNGLAYFVADDGIHGNELWRTDGTVGGTFMLKDIDAQPGYSSYVQEITDVNGTVFFQAKSDIWKTDGTANGTVSIKYIFSADLVNVNGTLFYGDGELWKSDGTASGTVQVADLAANGDSNPKNFAYIPGTNTVAFAISDGAGNYPIAKSDGTATGTGIVTQFMPGMQNAVPNSLIVAGSHLFFVGSDYTNKSQLYSLPLSAFESPPAITSAAAASGTVGQPFSYTITATGNPSSFNAAPLPAGLSLNAGTGVISGTPAAAGSTTVAISASNGAGTGSTQLSLTIVAATTGGTGGSGGTGGTGTGGQTLPPVITSPLTAAGMAGRPFTYTITASNSPASFNISGVPAGLTLDPVSGVLSGIPAFAGDISLELNAFNSSGVGKATLLLSVAPPQSFSTHDSDGDGFSDELESALGSSASDASATPLGGSSAAATKALVVAKLSIKLNFAKAASDSISLSGTLFVADGFVVATQQVAVSVGGVIRVFVLDSKGASPRDPAASFKMQIKAQKGLVAAQNAKYSIKLSKGDFAALLADEGLLNTDARNATLTVPVTVLISGQLYFLDAAQLYTARSGKSGRTKS